MRETMVHALIVIVLIAMVGTSSCWGQVENASVTGLVTDPSGAVIAGATVAVKNTAMNSSYTQQTDVTGHYFMSVYGSFRRTFIQKRTRPQTLKRLLSALDQEINRLMSIFAILVRHSNQVSK